MPFIALVANRAVLATVRHAKMPASRRGRASADLESESVGLLPKTASDICIFSLQDNMQAPLEFQEADDGHDCKP